ncbi:MAG: hypothetical protein LBP39_00390, partial [Rickettsiales bacterium]|nr:hypothetical protein [Rickettsiales bacterium]
KHTDSPKKPGLENTTSNHPSPNVDGNRIITSKEIVNQQPPPKFLDSFKNNSNKKNDASKAPIVNSQTPTLTNTTKNKIALGG